MKKNSSALYGYGYSLLLRKVAQNDKHFNCIVTTQNLFRFCFPRILNWSILVNIKPKKISYITTKYCLKIQHKTGLVIIAEVKDIHILKSIYSCLFSELWSNNQYTPNSQILLWYQKILDKLRLLQILELQCQCSSTFSIQALNKNSAQAFKQSISSNQLFSNDVGGIH